MSEEVGSRKTEDGSWKWKDFFVHSMTLSHAMNWEEFLLYRGLKIVLEFEDEQVSKGCI